jgi:hypothetical protein
VSVILVSLLDFAKPGVTSPTVFLIFLFKLTHLKIMIVVTRGQGLMGEGGLVSGYWVIVRQEQEVLDCYCTFHKVRRKDFECIPIDDDKCLRYF